MEQVILPGTHSPFVATEIVPPVGWSVKRAAGVYHQRLMMYQSDYARDILLHEGRRQLRRFDEELMQATPPKSPQVLERDRTRALWAIADHPLFHPGRHTTEQRTRVALSAAQGALPEASDRFLQRQLGFANARFVEELAEARIALAEKEYARGAQDMEARKAFLTHTLRRRERSTFRQVGDFIGTLAASAITLPTAWIYSHQRAIMQDGVPEAPYNPTGIVDLPKIPVKIPLPFTHMKIPVTLSVPKMTISIPENIQALTSNPNIGSVALSIALGLLGIIGIRALIHNQRTKNIVRMLEQTLHTVPNTSKSFVEQYLV